MPQPHEQKLHEVVNSVTLVSFSFWASALTAGKSITPPNARPMPPPIATFNQSLRLTDRNSGLLGLVGWSPTLLSSDSMLVVFTNLCRPSWTQHPQRLDSRRMSQTNAVKSRRYIGMVLIDTVISVRGQRTSIRTISRDSCMEHAKRCFRYVGQITPMRLRDTIPQTRSLDRRVRMNL